MRPARITNKMYLPLYLENQAKIMICFTHPRRSWPYILEPTMVMIHVRSGNLRSNWCCKSLITLTRQAIGEKAVIDRVTKMVNSLEKQLTVI